MADDPWSWSATTAVERLSKGEISASELLRSVRARVDAVNCQVNALPTTCFDRAEAKAAEIENKALAERGRFKGLPWPIKDSAAVDGVRTTYGSTAFSDHIPRYSDYLVEAIEAEDGVVFAKSNTPEFEAGANTFNDIFGRTLNPFDLKRSAGGSSGGAAVAVATGMAFVAQGSDFACSLRYPAAFCNVVGLRPSPGLVPMGPSPLPFQTLSVAGPIARNVADVGLAMDGMVRFDLRDPLSRASSATYLRAAQAPQRPSRAAFSMDLGLSPVDRVVRKTVVDAVQRLAREGLRIGQAEPDLLTSHGAFKTLRAFQFAALHRDTFDKHRARLKPEVVWNIEEGLKLDAATLAVAEAERSILRGRMMQFLSEHEFLITPTAPVEPFPVEERYVSSIDGCALPTYLDWLALGYAVTICGCPAISIPCGLSENGLPIGIQLIGRPYREHDLLSAAAWCEAVLGCALATPVEPSS